MPHPSARTPVTLAVVGAGSRGSGYARIAAQLGLGRVVAVAEPEERRRNAFAGEHGLSGTAVAADWRDLLTHDRVADAVVIATPDRDHLEVACAFAEAGYAMLLEKPMAPLEADARKIVEVAERNDVLLAVCHVMRYSRYSRALTELVRSGAIGELVSVEHLEPIGWWHFAHSYVRGSWAVEATSSSMLLAKACHDIDWLGQLTNRPVRRVSSFGSLSHFRPENRPAGATERCLDCPVSPTCAYSAPRIYERFLGDPAGERWPLSVLTDDISENGLRTALRDGPYGRCVYSGGNDVVDHQVVNLEYEGGVTASVSVVAFSTLDFRKTRLFGTRGSIAGDGRTLVVHDFVTDTERTIVIDPEGSASAADGHGGADTELMRAFLDAVATGERSLITSGPRESLESHLVVWAAERARRDGTVVTLPDQPH